MLKPAFIKFVLNLNINASETGKQRGVIARSTFSFDRRGGAGRFYINRSGSRRSEHLFLVSRTAIASSRSMGEIRAGTSDVLGPSYGFIEVGWFVAISQSYRHMLSSTGSKSFSAALLILEAAFYVAFVCCCGVGDL